MSELARVEANVHTQVDEEQLVTMMVDGQLFGIPILKVQDIVEPTQITTVPLAPSAIAGVLNLRGRIVTVIDLRECLGSIPKKRDKMMSVTVEHKGDLYTLLVDSIGDVRSLPRRDFDKPPSTLEERMRKLCSGIFRLENDLLAVLDVDRVLSDDTITSTPKRRPRPKKRTENKEPAASLAAAANDAAESLYQRLGGEAVIDAIVDLTRDRAANDDRLRSFLGTGDKTQQLRSAKAFLTNACGGPASAGTVDVQLVQRRLQGMGFDAGHYLGFAAHLSDTLIQMGLPENLIDEVMTVAGNLKGEMLGE